jgi:hypothetical protein
MGLLVCTLVVSLAAAAFADVPNLTLSTAERPGMDEQTDPLVVMFNMPDGTGKNFTEAKGTDGLTYDSTIVLILRNDDGDPIANYPNEDMWVFPTDNDSDDSFFGCVDGTIADVNTTDIGRTEWVLPMNAGGFTADPNLPNPDVTQVYVSGLPLQGSGFGIAHNSCDVTSDGAVNLADTGAFAGDYYGAGYVFRSDFNFDGNNDLADLGIFADRYGGECPGEE